MNVCVDRSSLSAAGDAGCAGLLRSDQKSLDRNREALLSEVQVEDLLPYLLEKAVFTDGDATLIRMAASPEDQMAKLVSLLPMSGQQAYDELKQAMKPKYQHIIDKMNDTSSSTTMMEVEGNFHLLCEGSIMMR